MFLLPLLLFAVATGAADVTLLTPLGDVAETSLAISGDRVVLATMAHTAPAPVEIFVSRDRGISWVKAPDRELLIGGKTYAYAGDPTLVTLDDGSFGLAYLANSATVESENGEMVLVYERSADGVTWTPPLVIDVGPTNRFLLGVDKPTISIDRITNTLYLAWTRNAPGSSQSVIASSADRGAHWSTPLAVSNSNHENSVQAVVTASGTLVVTSFNATIETYLSRFSNDRGATFSAPQSIGSEASTYHVAPSNAYVSPVQTTVAFRDDVYLAFPTRKGVFFTRSRDGGQMWSDPLRLGGASGYAIMPSIAVDENSGDVMVSWLDSRDDASGATYRLYAAQSSDGGASFDAPLAFSPPFAIGTPLGDYDGSVAIQKGVAVTTFAAAGGHLNVVRLAFTPPPPRRRAVVR
jgi:hypothetical protein